MGNGPNKSRDAPKAPPRALHDLALAVLGHVDGVIPDELRPAVAGAAVGGGQVPGPIDFCARGRDLAVKLFDGVSAAVGQPVRLLVGRPPRVMDIIGEQIGTVSDPQESAIAHCLIDGYEMSGEILAIDAEHATIRIAGERRSNHG